VKKYLTLLTLILLALTITPPTSAVEGYAYYQTINYSGCDQAIYQQDIVIHRSNGSAYEETTRGLNIWHLYVEDHCQPDYADVRFTNTTHELDHYLWEDQTNSTQALFTVRLEDANTNGSITIWYGNGAAESESNGTNTFDFFDDFNFDSDELYVNRISFISNSGKNVYANQGVATDGTYVYTTNNTHLCKYDMSWNSIDSVNLTPYMSTNYRPGDLCYYDGDLYLATHYNEDVGSGEILVCSASDLSYVDTLPLSSPSGNYNCGAITINDGYAWVLWDNKNASANMYIDQYTLSSWSYVDRHTITNSITGYKLQGIVFIGNYLYGPLHEAVSANGVEVYRWTGSGFTFITRLSPPTSYCTQGIDWDGEQFWFAERAHSGVSGNNYVVKASGDYIDSSKWTVTGTPTTSGGIATLIDTSGNEEFLTTKTSFNDPLILYARLKSGHMSDSGNEGVQFRSASSTDRISAFYSHDGGPSPIYYIYESSEVQATISGWSADTWHTQEIQWINTNTAKFYVDGANEVVISNTNVPTSRALTLRLFADRVDGARLDCDYILTRKYSATPPSATAFFAEYANVPPTADFSASPTSGPDPLTVQFTDLSTGGPTSWLWNFGDGYTSTAQNPAHIYLYPGQYSVSLTAQNAYGYDEIAKPYYITVTSSQVPPTADFSASPTSGPAPLTISFTDESAGSPTSWTWEFGDGLGSAAQDPTHIYAVPGDYTVTLTAYNAAGSDVETKSEYISVEEQAQPADAVINGYTITGEELLDDVIVTINNDTYSTTTTSHSGGFYQFNNLSPGLYTIYGSKTGYTTSPEYAVQLYTGTVVQQHITLGSTNTASLVGTVYNAVTGAKIEGANITVTQGGAQYTTSTGSEGNYTITGPTSGTTVEIAATLTGYTHTPISFAPASGANTADLYLIPESPSYNGTALAGLVTESVHSQAISGATITLSTGENTTSSYTGWYQFDNLTAGPCSVSAVATGYTDSSDYTVTLTEGNLTQQDITLTATIISGTGSGVQYPPHNVQFKIMNIFGSPIEGVTVTAVGYETTAGSWDWLYSLLGISTDVQIEGTTMTGTTGSDGCIDFMMFESVKYTLNFSKAGEVAEIMTVYPHESYYPVYAISLSSIINQFYTDGASEYQSVLVNVSTSTDESGATITVKYQDTLAATTGGTVTLMQVNQASGEEELISSYSITGNTFSHDFEIADYEGQSYFVRVRATHSTFPDGINRDFGITFPGERLNFGLPDGILIWIAMFIMTVTALMFGPSAAIQGLPVICFEGWIFLAIGWLRDLGDINAAGLLVIMSFVAVVANIMGASKRARQQG